jgi:hypothetical protein
VTRRLNRRQALAGFGSVSLGALLAACGDGSSSPTRTPVATTDGGTATVEPRGGAGLAPRFDESATCTLTPELAEGPYYFDANAIRSDIRDGRAGTTLRLGIRVRDAGECAPLRDAVVDIWHCDAAGEYSSEPERFLRGTQVTGADGIVTFTTIYPGSYEGRTVHIHAKVHVNSEVVLTTQLFFEDAITTAVLAAEPYAAHGERRTSNDSDGIFDPATMLTLSEEGDGYVGLITFDLVRVEA